MKGRRASWSGSLKIALIAAPIKLYKVTCQSDRLTAHFIHGETRNRVHMIPYDPELGKVSRADLVNGYILDKAKPVVIDDVELAGIKPSSDKALSIDHFITSGDIDPLYFDQPYVIMPDDSNAIEVVDLLCRAMASRQKTAIARILIGRRERMAAITPRGRGLVLTTLRHADEIQDPATFFDKIPDLAPSIEHQNLAEQLIATRNGRFEPHSFEDRYQAALKVLIEHKLLHGETATFHHQNPDRNEHVPPSQRLDTPTPRNVAEAFRQSLTARRKPPAKSRSKRAGDNDRAAPSKAKKAAAIDGER